MTNTSQTIGLKWVGYFRFVSGFSDPIGALATAIEEAKKSCPEWSVSDSLIVLPEAFNMGHVYEPPAPELPAGELLEQLRTRLAAPLRISFVVASLIELIQRTGSLQAAANSFVTKWVTTGRNCMTLVSTVRTTETRSPAAMPGSAR